MEVDAAVGRVLDMVRASPGLLKNTFVFLTSDNGAQPAEGSKVNTGDNGECYCDGHCTTQATETVDHL